MSYIDSLIEHGTHFRVEPKPGSLVFKPADATSAALQSFQSVVDGLRGNEGAGYAIFKTHELSDRPGNLIDLVIVTLDED